MSDQLVIRPWVTAMPQHLQTELAICWMDVANSGGAVGFPVTPVSFEVVADAVLTLAQEVENEEVILILARLDEALVGWVTLRLNRANVTAHWATLERLQSHPGHRGTGVGSRLLTEATYHARQLGLEQLRLVLRGGEGLESFYQRHGWSEFGRHCNALRFAEADDRDEVYMVTMI